MTKTRTELLMELPLAELLEANATLTNDLTAARLGARTPLHELATEQRIPLLERVVDALRAHAINAPTEPFLFTPSLMAAYKDYAERWQLVAALTKIEPTPSSNESAIGITANIAGRAVMFPDVPWDLGRAALLQLAYVLQTRAAERLNTELLNIIQSKLPPEPQKDISEMVQVDAKGPYR